MHFEGTHDTIGANHAGDGERYIVQAILAIEDSGAGQDGMLIIEHSLDEAAGRHRDTRVREALLVDDVVSDLYELLLDGFAIQRLRLVEVLVHMLEAETTAVDRRPGDECGIAVLAENIAVDVFRIHEVLIGEDAAETIGLQHRARAEDEVARIIELVGNDVRSDIERVRDHDDHGFLRVLHDLTEDGAHDLGVRASQLQAIRRLTRADGRTSRDDDDVCIIAVAVVTEMELDVRAVDAGRSVAGVESLALGLSLVEVDECDLRSELEVCDLVGNGGTDVAGTDDDDLSSVVHGKNTPHKTRHDTGCIPARNVVMCGYVKNIPNSLQS